MTKAYTLATAAVAGLLVAAPASPWRVAAVAAEADSKSAPLVQELGTLMAQQKLTAVAAKNPEVPDAFVAALLYPGVQLLLVSGQPVAPAAAQAQLDRREYNEVYMTLQQAVVPETKIFFQDLKADGLHAMTPDGADVVYERVVEQMIFDGVPARHKLSAAQYAKAFATADARYSRLLESLLAQLRPHPGAPLGE